MSTIFNMDVFVKLLSFLVALGNYGNRSEKSTMVQTSTTQSINPVHDGTAYSYIPWTHSKPCIVIDSFWEDCSYRIGFMNLFNNIANKLVILYSLLTISRWWLFIIGR